MLLYFSSLFFNVADKLKVNNSTDQKPKWSRSPQRCEPGDEQLPVQTEDTEKAEICAKSHRRFITAATLQQHQRPF